jgi:HAD superfamily hydrolase (TIGR01509 family)
MARKLKEELSLIPNAMEIISECREYGLKVALVTASGGVLMNNVLQRFPEDFFDTTVCADDVVKSKPDPAPYLLAAQKLEADITKCLVVEDSITGVTSGLASGAQVIGIPHLVNLPVNDNLRIVKSLSDLSLSKLLLWYPFLTGVVND